MRRVGRRAELLGNFGIRPPQAEVINNGIRHRALSGRAPDLRAELGLAEKFVVGTVTRLVPGKGLDVLIDSFAELARLRPDARLVIAGGGPLEATLQVQAAQTGFGQRILFTGARSDMPAVYNTFDVFVLASFDEGMPMTVLESMSSGRAVIATAVGAIPRLVRDRQNGRLIPARDPQALTEALTGLAADGEARAAYGRAARVTIEQEFSSLAMARQYLSHYRQIRVPQQEAA